MSELVPTVHHLRLHGDVGLVLETRAGPESEAPLFRRRPRVQGTRGATCRRASGHRQVTQSAEMQATAPARVRWWSHPHRLFMPSVAAGSAGARAVDDLFADAEVLKDVRQQIVSGATSGDLLQVQRGVLKVRQ